MRQVLKDGRLQRFCQQCGRFHDLAAFDAGRKSCREQLSKHNARRRRRAQIEAQKNKVRRGACAHRGTALLRVGERCGSQLTTAPPSHPTVPPLHARVRPKQALEKPTGAAALITALTGAPLVAPPALAAALTPTLPALAMTPPAATHPFGAAATAAAAVAAAAATDDAAAAGDAGAGGGAGAAGGGGGGALADVGRLLTALMQNPTHLHALRLLLGVQTHPALPALQPFSPEPAPLAPGGALGAAGAAAGRGEPPSFTLAREVADGKGPWAPNFESDHRVSLGREETTCSRAGPLFP